MTKFKPRLKSQTSSASIIAYLCLLMTANKEKIAFYIYACNHNLQFIRICTLQHKIERERERDVKLHIHEFMDNFLACINFQNKQLKEWKLKSSHAAWYAVYEKWNWNTNFLMPKIKTLENLATKNMDL